MEINTRRNFFGKIAATAALMTGALKLLAQQTPPAGGLIQASSALGWKAASRIVAILREHLQREITRAIAGSQPLL